MKNKDTYAKEAQSGRDSVQALKETEKKDKRIRIMEEVPWKAVLKMGLPIAMGMLFMVAYNLVDTYFIGMLGDSNQLAASSLSYPVLIIMIAVSGIVGNGGASYIARCTGAAFLPWGTMPSASFFGARAPFPTPRSV